MPHRSTSAASLTFAPRRRLAGLLAGASLLLAACGGGVWIGDDGWDDDDYVRPDVSIAAPAQAQAGSTVTLTAAASDDWSGIDQVAFYRIDPRSGGGTVAVLVASGRSRPYETPFTVPSDGRTTVEVFAWARDRAGNTRDSAVVSIAIVP